LLTNKAFDTQVSKLRSYEVVGNSLSLCLDILEAFVDSMVGIVRGYLMPIEMPPFNRVNIMHMNSYLPFCISYVLMMDHFLDVVRYWYKSNKF